MKQFAVQAICDEKSLWEIMQVLEQQHCVGILARPLSNGAGKPVSKAGKRVWGGLRDSVLQAMTKNGGKISLAELAPLLKQAGYTSKPDNIMYILKRAKKVRRVKSGVYQLVRSK
jgi:hypothetical protein